MKKNRIITACVTAAFIIGIAVSYILGIAHGVTREIEGSLAISVAYCNWIDNGNIDRLTNTLNMALISQLNTIDSLDNNRLYYGGWYLLTAKKSSVSAGERWSQIRDFAETRVKKQRDEWNYLMSDPEEAARRLEHGFEKAFRESGRSNVNVKVTSGRKGSIGMELENWEQQDAQQ